MSYFSDITFISATRRVSSNYTSNLIENTSYSIEYISDGSISLAVNGKLRLLTAPVAFWMLPGNTYQFLPANDRPFEHFWSDFYGPRAERMLKCIDARFPKGSVRVSKPIEFEMIFDEMIKTHKDFPIYKRYEAVICLEHLAGFIYSSAIGEEKANQKHNFIEEVASKIKLSPLNEYDFKKIARQNNISYEHFRKLFREQNGMAPHNCLLQCRMEHAAKTFQDGEVSIKELASSHGFADISSFFRMFKRKMGASPAKYLAMYKRK